MPDSSGPGKVRPRRTGQRPAPATPAHRLPGGRLQAGKPPARVSRSHDGAITIDRFESAARGPRPPTLPYRALLARCVESVDYRPCMRARAVLTRAARLVDNGQDLACCASPRYQRSIAGRQFSGQARALDQPAPSFLPTVTDGDLAAAARDRVIACRSWPAGGAPESRPCSSANRRHDILAG